MTRVAVVLVVALLIVVCIPWIIEIGHDHSRRSRWDR